MTSFGKKIIGAFLEVEAREQTASSSTAPGNSSTSPIKDPPDTPRSVLLTSEPAANERTDALFAGHFDKLLGDANIPGPDYYEFARMIAAMQGIPDEAARYNAAFAGLQVQGLDRQRLLDTAAEYLKVLTTDAEQFGATVEASYQEKVRGKETEAEQMATRIQSLSQEIMQLQQRITALKEEVKATKDKLSGSTSAYTCESKRRQNEIRRNIEKINQYIH